MNKRMLGVLSCLLVLGASLPLAIAELMANDIIGSILFFLSFVSAVYVLFILNKNDD